MPGRGIEIHNGYAVVPSTKLLTSQVLSYPNNKAMDAEIEINGAITLTGEVYGLLGGISVEAAATIAGLTLIDIFISSYVLSAPGSHTFIWCAENGSQAVLRCMAFYIGGTATCTNFLFLSPSNCPGGAWHVDGACTGAQGYLKVDMQGTARYIQLYTTPP